jgi:murein DD-endopeptidase MepM/ murein hydrolase activator NlpD
VSLADRGLAALALAVLLLSGLAAQGGGVPSLPPRPLLKVAPLPLPNFVRQGVLTSGETVAHLGARLGLPVAEMPQWLAAVQRQIDPRALPVGLVAEAVFDSQGTVKALRLTPDWRSTVIVERGADGLRARREARPVERRLVVVSGTVHSSLFDAMGSTGESDNLAMELADLFQWDIDFHREVREGDTFALLVERVTAGGATVAYGPVLAAAYNNRGRRYTAVRYAFGGGKESYYDEHGSPLRKQFLRAPLRFSRLTSRFSLFRMHPILGERLPHWGVDYGAPVGTPVMATAEGMVAFTGSRGGAGNEVEIRHAGGFVTAYLHLSRFASGIRPGVRVAQGQVIGFVGNTGMSTGPHLDYRITQNGHHINPLTVGKEPAPPLPKDELPRFARWAGEVLPLLAAPGPLPAKRLGVLQAGAPDLLHG